MNSLQGANLTRGALTNPNITVFFTLHKPSPQVFPYKYSSRKTVFIEILRRSEFHLIMQICNSSLKSQELLHMRAKKSDSQHSFLACISNQHVLWLCNSSCLLLEICVLCFLKDLPLSVWISDNNQTFEDFNDIHANCWRWHRYPWLIVALLLLCICIQVLTWYKIVTWNNIIINGLSFCYL